MEQVTALMKTVCESSFSNELRRRWGTGGGGYAFGAHTSSEPPSGTGRRSGVMNGDLALISSRTDSGLNKYWGDYGCPTTCLKLAVIRTGKFKGAITDNPDYELQAYLGTNLGIFTPEEKRISGVSN